MNTLVTRPANPTRRPMPERRAQDVRPELPGVTWLGTNTLAHHGPQAALFASPVARDVLDAAYKHLPPGARQNLLLANRWKLWAVLATEDWAITHGKNPKPPTA